MTRLLLTLGLIPSFICLPALALADTEAAVVTDVPVALPETATNDSGTVAKLEDETVSLRVVGTEAVSRLTGADSSNETAERWDIYGADLGHMFWHRDQLHMVFGDTFGSPGLGGKNWRSNTMARIADPDPRSGLPFESMITGPNGHAKELLPSLKVDGVEKTVIPTQGVSIGGRMHLHYMSVRLWAPVGGVWFVRHSGLAYSDDDGQTWTQPEEAVWPAGSGFEQVAFVKHEGLVYTFGIPEGRFGGVRLRRVVPERILERDAYEYWDGAKWVADLEAAAVIVPAPVGELSVEWSEPHRLWLMMYLDQKRRVVVLRTAPRLTGPWSETQVVATAEKYPRLYAPYIVPGSEIDTDLYFTMSQWGPYNVFLMHTTLEPAAPAMVSAGDPVPADDVLTPASATPN